MPLFIKDPETSELVATLANLRGVSKKEAVRQAVTAELRRASHAVPIRQRLEQFWADHPLPAKTGEVADKAFFDDLSGDA